MSASFDLGGQLERQQHWQWQQQQQQWQQQQQIWQ
jgi:hypothetical protein